jgi:hypothetical protein
LQTRARDFSGHLLDPQQDQDGVFCYKPSSELSEKIKTEFPSVLNAATKEVEHIDMVIFPECALDEKGQKELENALADKVGAYIAGVRRKPRDEDYDVRKDSEINSVCFGFKNKENVDWVRVLQDKHHRWRLNGWQIRSYQLGGQLHPNYNWWEELSVKRRRVSFVNLGEELTVCPLICEDLARQGPVSELIRTVGPSLVVSILMDGPQLRDRWAARYANVLGDDPGSSVITLTSAGMVDRYRVPGRERRPRSIALWSDRTGAMTEIELPIGADAVILSLAVDTLLEGTIDRRKEKIGTYTLTFGGAQPVFAER